MKIDKTEISAVLTQFNPWWDGLPVADLPSWKRAAYAELWSWISKPPVPRAIMLSGARQVGKTTLAMQAIVQLIETGTPSSNILYATFDHPTFKLAGIEAVLEVWREREPRRDGPEYLFLDEAQYIQQWGTWIKHQVDFQKHRRIIFTGSAMPLLVGQESGVGRWHGIRLTTLSFYEYVQLRKITLPELPHPKSLRDLFSWNDRNFAHVSTVAGPYLANFQQYLVRGGFPQTAMVETITQAQKLLREDIIDKALKRDMTALFGVRKVIDLEYTFLYLCRHDGGILDMGQLAGNLQVSRALAQRYIDLFEATHLAYRLAPFGYGKEVLRGRFKLYLADAAIAPAVLMKGAAVLDDAEAMGVAAEAAVLKHLSARYYRQNVHFSYWRKNNSEVDLVAEIEGDVVPLEVKYRNQPRAAKGLNQFCAERNVARGYIVSKSLSDFGIMPSSTNTETPILRIPASLLCYWMGETEVS